MDATIDIKSLEEAVTIFYRSGAQQQSNAHDWLTKAQMSPQAWSFVWDLMQLGKVIKKKLGKFHFRRFGRFNIKIQSIHFYSCSHRKFNFLVQQHCIRNY